MKTISNLVRALCYRSLLATQAVSVLFVAASALSTTGLAGQTGLAELVRRVQPAVVTITTFDTDGNRLAQGTGFFLSRNGDIATNWHVVAGATLAEARTSDGRSFSIRTLLRGNEAADLAVVSGVGLSTVPDALVLAQKTPSPGDPVVVVGSPLGLEASVSSGIVSAVRNLPGQGPVLQITASISPGSSGSPVLNMDGEVVGIATMRLIQGQDLNFAVPSNLLAALPVGTPRSLPSRSVVDNPSEAPAPGLIGARLRVTSSTLAAGHLTGLLMAADQETLVLDAPTLSAPVRVRIKEVQRVEISEGTSTQALKGAAIGAAIGAVIGIVAGFAGGGDETDPSSTAYCVSGCVSAAGYAALGGLTGGAIGGLFGFALGKNRTVERWTPVPIERLRGR